MSNKQQLIDYLSKNPLVCEQYMFEDGDPIPGGWMSTVVDGYDGEDCGSDYWSVYKFTKDGEDVYIKFKGYYQSHYGADYEGFREVEPAKKEITVWK